MVEETPLMAWMCGPADVGGLGWSEGFAVCIQRILGSILLVATLLVFIPALRILLLAIAFVELAIATSAVRMHTGFQISASLMPLDIVSLIPYASHAGRIAAPLGLWLISSPILAFERDRRGLALGGLRCAIAATFFAHGIEAWMHYPEFIDMTILAAGQLAGWRLGEGASRGLLTLIGLVDMLVATIAVSRRWPPVAWYMAGWGFVTAISRVVAHGWTFWYETAIRVPHAGIPIAIALWWMSEADHSTTGPCR
jgi:hypothetical protein